MKYSVTFLPQNIVTHAPEGTTVFNAANWAGLPIDSTCGGRGTCGKCKVRLLAGADGVTDADHKYLSASELEAGWRLSCRSAVHGECVAEVPRLMTSPKAALLGYGQHVLLDPNMPKVAFPACPSLPWKISAATWRGCLAVVRDEGYEVRVDPAVWRALPMVLRANDFERYGGHRRRRADRHRARRHHRLGVWTGARHRHDHGGGRHRQRQDWRGRGRQVDAQRPGQLWRGRHFARQLCHD